MHYPAVTGLQLTSYITQFIYKTMPNNTGIIIIIIIIIYLTLPYLTFGADRS